jgi:hypothetical protein
VVRGCSIRLEVHLEGALGVDPEGRRGRGAVAEGKKTTAAVVDILEGV